MQVEPKDEEEVDELAGGNNQTQAGAPASAIDEASAAAGASSMMDEDKAGKEAAATLMQASTSMRNAAAAAQPPAPEVGQPSSLANPPPAGTAAHGAASAAEAPHQESQTAGPICANCSTQTTSLWRRSPEGQTLCNACSLYQKMKGTPRPVSLKTDVIKHRNRSKGDRKSAKEKEAAMNSSTNTTSGTSTPNTSSTIAASGKAKKNHSNAANKASRQGSLAPSTASSVIREEEMEGDEEDDGDASYLAGNRSLAASTGGGAGDSSMISSKAAAPAAESEHAQKKARTANDNLHTRPTTHGISLTPAQLQAQQAAYSAATSRRPPNAAHPHHPYSFFPPNHPHHHSPYPTDRGSARAREMAAAFALSNAGSGAGQVGRRTVSVDGRSTPTGTPHGGQSQPIPWNIASYFSGMAERERQKQAHAHLLTLSNANSASNSRANTASQPNSAPSSATVSPTSTSIHDPPVPSSASASQLAAAKAAAQAQAGMTAPFPLYQHHPHSNFLAAYRARQLQASQSYANPAAREKSEVDKEEKEKASATAKEAANGSISTAANGPQKDWSPRLVSRTDPRLAGNMYGGAQSEAARMAHLATWRPPSSSYHRDGNSVSRSRPASPAGTASRNAAGGVDPRSASTSRAGSRHNTPPHSTASASNASHAPIIHPHPPLGATRLLFGLPTVYPRAASSDHPNSARTAHSGATANGYPGGSRSFDSMTDEDREKQKARLDQLFAAAGQRLSAAQQQQQQQVQAQAAKNGTKAEGQAIASAPGSATSTPAVKDLASASAESAVGRSPANVHHASYRPYDLTHRSSSRAASATSHAGYSSAPGSTVLGPRTSPNHLTSTLHLGKKAERRPGSPSSHSSLEDQHENDAALAGGERQRHWGSHGRIATKGVSAAGLSDSMISPAAKIREDGMVIDEVGDDHLMALEDQEFLDGLSGLPKTTAASLASRESPPFGFTFDNPSTASERRGRSTTRKLRDGLLGEDDGLAHQVGDRVAHDLGALRMRDSSRSSSQIRSHSRSPDWHAKGASIGAPPYPELPHFSQLSEMANPNTGAFPRSSIPTAELDDGIVKNALTHRPISDMRASASPHPTLPSLSEALSSSNSSRSISAGHTGSSRHSSAARTAMSHRGLMEEGGATVAGVTLPPPNFGSDEAARLRTRVQELEFINGLMEARVAELETTITGNPDKAGVTILAPHGPNCSCRCSEIDSEALKAAEHLKKELLTHGVGGIGEQASRDLLDLLAHRLGYKAGAVTTAPTAKSQSPSGSNGMYPIT